MWSWFVWAVVLTGHGTEELIRALCCLFRLSLRLLAPSSAIQGWTQCRKKQWLGKQIHMDATTLCTLSVLCPVIRLLTTVANTSTVMFLSHLSRGIDKPGWEHHEFLGVWCCFLLTPLMFSAVFSPAGIEPSGCYAWEIMGWTTFSRALFILRYNKGSMETKGGFNWANWWCLRSL